MEPIKSLQGMATTVAGFCEIPGMPEKIREAYFRDARREGLSECDADDGAQLAFVRWLACELEPVHAFYSVRKYMRLSRYAGFSGARKASRRKLWEPIHATNSRMRGEWVDNPAALAIGMETVDSLLMTACGRNAKAIRSMSRGDIRALACPDMRGASEREPGECPRIVDHIPRTLPPTKPMRAVEGDGTAWRSSDPVWQEVSPGHYVSLRGQ